MCAICCQPILGNRALIIVQLFKKLFRHVSTHSSRNRQEPFSDQVSYGSSYPDKTPDSIKQYLDNDQYRLYKLIWEKFMSSQMSNAEMANKSIEITSGDYTLKAGTSKITFDGFLKL